MGKNIQNEKIIILKQDIRNQVNQLLMLRQYEQAETFVNQIVFSNDSFIYTHILDEWIRYIQILLEIVKYERNFKIQPLTADKFEDYDSFYECYREVRFAIRYILFHFKEADKIIELYQKHSLSAEFVAVAIKNSVPEKYVNGVFEDVCKVFEQAGCTDFVNRLGCYADNYAMQKPGVCRLEMQKAGDGHENEMSVIYLDARKVLKKISKTAGKDQQKVCYILCGNNSRYIEEVCRYLQHQILPEGYRGEIFVVEHAKSMTQGYNSASDYTDAYYKIYIHQDTFIFDRFYTKKIIEELDKGDYQLLGVAGGKELPDSGRWGDGTGDKFFSLLQDYVLYVMDAVNYVENRIEEVQVLDGVLLATKENISWREDLFTHFHFYDISVCVEYKKRGYHIGVFCDQMPGVLHEVNVEQREGANTEYEKARQIFLKEYADML